MKRVYWLLIAAVPVVLWWLSQGASRQEAQQPAAAKPERETPVPPSDAAPEPAKEMPTSSNGASPRTTAPPEEVSPDPIEQVQEAAQSDPEISPQIEVAPEVVVKEASVDVAEETVQVLDSKDRPQNCQLLEITKEHALVRCPEDLPEREKVRLVLPFADQAITVNGQLLSIEDGVSRFKIMVMKAGQKKRFEEFLGQRPA